MLGSTSRAKAISGKLGDKKFVSQAVNYANNDGVVWCVLTNGVRYRVFKTNEVASMDRKLLFEVDLAQEHQPVAQKAQQLALISRQSVVNGDLDRYGERVFTDSRVRAALAILASTPSPAFLAEFAGLLGSPAVPEAALRRSFGRVLEAPMPAQPPVAQAGDAVVAALPAVAAVSAGKGKYTLDHHIAGRAVAMRELWEAVDGYAQALGVDIERKLNKQSMGYYRGKRAFCSAQVRNNRVLMHVKIDPKSVIPWNGDVMRDVSAIGHWGNGDLEYSLTSVDQLNELRTLVGRAYSENA